MIDPREFREIVSGRRRGLAASALRGMLRTAETPYTFAVNRRNNRFDTGKIISHRVVVPVISVGNLTLGGTGKTPVVKWIVRWFAERGMNVGIVSRGYGASAGRHNDEAVELAQSLPNVPHVQNPDRVAAAQRAINEHHVQAIVLDDGFQHRRLARDLDIVLLDALEPFGFEHVFPRGTLREPVAGLTRAQVVCLSRADAVSSTERNTIRERVQQFAPHAAWCELAHAPSQLINANGDARALDALMGKRVAAFCGIGNPAGFEHTLAATGCTVAAWRVFADHHRYSDADAAALAAMARARKADMAVCTHKDLVKLQTLDLGGVPLWAVSIDMQFLSGQTEFEQALASAAKMPA